MEIKQLNELLGNLHNPDPKKLKLIKTEQGHTGIPETYDDGNQGEYNEFSKIYQIIGDPDNLFLKITYNTDSYGSNEHPVSVAFVKGKEKKITVYEYD